MHVIHEDPGRQRHVPVVRSVFSSNWQLSGKRWWEGSAQRLCFSFGRSSKERWTVRQVVPCTVFSGPQPESPSQDHTEGNDTENTEEWKHDKEHPLPSVHQAEDSDLRDGGKQKYVSAWYSKQIPSLPSLPSQIPLYWRCEAMELEGQSSNNDDSSTLDILSRPA